MTRAQAFSLVELLVVIAIVALLIALLLPSLAKARYQATLTLCGARLRQVGVALLSYSTDSQGRFPYRGLNNSPGSAARFDYIKYDSPAFDDRPLYRPYITIDTLQCPFSTPASYSANASNGAVGYLSYTIFAGTRLLGSDAATDFYRDTHRPRYTFSYTGASKTIQVMAADIDQRFRPPPGNPSWGYSRITSHPDSPSSMPRYERSDSQLFYTFYFVGGSAPAMGMRNEIDMNQVKTDGSVTTVGHVQESDPRYFEIWSAPQQGGSGDGGTSMILPE